MGNNQNSLTPSTILSHALRLDTPCEQRRTMELIHDFYLVNTECSEPEHKETVYLFKEAVNALLSDLEALQKGPYTLDDYRKVEALMPKLTHERMAMLYRLRDIICERPDVFEDQEEFEEVLTAILMVEENQWRGNV